MIERHLDMLAFRFFKLFAQYESSLKEQRFFQVKNGIIKVDWNKFANERIGKDFLQQLGENQEAANFILTSPPMKQKVNDDGEIIWDEVDNSNKSVQDLFGHICRMRNNLFHGAKFNQTWFDPDRSRSLLSSGLVILEHFADRVLTSDSEYYV